MQTKPISEVLIPESRQRSVINPDRVKELAQSIREEGLFHAIILDESGNLVAGMTRFHAIKFLADQEKGIIYDHKAVKIGHIPYTTTHKTDPISLFKIELEENLRREQLSPVDEAIALARLHELKQQAAPEILPGLKAEVEFQETAKEIMEIKGEKAGHLNAEITKVSDSILIEAYKDEPGVKKAKTHKEAVREARKAAQRQMQAVYGEMTIGEKADSKHLVICGDCEAELPNIAAESVNVIIADPPYGMGADSFGEQSLGHDYKDDEDAWLAVTGAILHHASRVCKPDAAMFIFCDFPQWDSLRSDLQNTTNWYVWPTPLIWHKTNRGHAPQPKRGPSRRYETILYAIRGNLEVRQVGSDVLSFAVPDVRIHAAQKPVDLYTELLSWVAYPGDVILDPCAGVGTSIAAAQLSDCSAIAVERDAGFAAHCREIAEKENA